MTDPRRHSLPALTPIASETATPMSIDDLNRSAPNAGHSFKSLLLVLAILAASSPWISPPIALTMGIAIALAGWAAFPTQTRKWSRLLIQAGVVLLGFRMDLHQIVAAGTVGVGFAVGTILLTFAAGALLAHLLGIDRKVATLISSGTAVCGGSAIAATGSVIFASEAQMAVAMGCVFILNSIGLYIFPTLGHALQLSGEQFGTWAAIAIHDISSVVGSAAVFDQLEDTNGVALETATAVKLTRTLWIVPVALLCGWWHQRADARIVGASKTCKAPPMPWFIGLFLLAATARSVVPAVIELAPHIELVAKKLLTIALLFIGLGMSTQAIAAVGWRAMVLAIALWFTISTVALVVVVRTIP